MRGKLLQEEVFKIICNKWPVHVREVIENLELDPSNISNVTKVRYHFYALKKHDKIKTKKIGKALVAWPTEIEKLRFIHELLEV